MKGDEIGLFSQPQRALVEVVQLLWSLLSFGLAVKLIQTLAGGALRSLIVVCRRGNCLF